MDASSQLKEKAKQMKEWRKRYNILTRTIPDLHKLHEKIKSEKAIKFLFDFLRIESGVDFAKLLDDILAVIDCESPCGDCDKCSSSDVFSLTDVVTSCYEEGDMCDARKSEYLSILKNLGSWGNQINSLKETLEIGQDERSRYDELNVLHDFGIGHLELKRKMLQSGEFTESDFDTTEPEIKKILTRGMVPELKKLASEVMQIDEEHNNR